MALALLLDDEATPWPRVAAQVEQDMALAAAVLRSVNSGEHGAPVVTVVEAVQRLGLREVALHTFALALAGAFPPTPALEALWGRATRRGLALGRMAGSLGVEPWAAHSVGLFAEAGEALLWRQDEALAARLRARHPEPLDRCSAEIQAFGLSHAALGGALCQLWGLAPAVAEAVRLRPLALALGRAGAGWGSGDEVAARPPGWGAGAWAGRPAGSGAPPGSGRGSIGPAVPVAEESAAAETERLGEECRQEPLPVRQLMALMAAADLAPESEGPLDAGAVEAETRWAAACRTLAGMAGLDPAALVQGLGRALGCTLARPALV